MLSTYNIFCQYFASIFVNLIKQCFTTLTIVFPALTALSKSYQTVMKSIPKVLN